MPFEADLKQVKELLLDALGIEFRSGEQQRACGLEDSVKRNHCGVSKIKRRDLPDECMKLLGQKHHRVLRYVR
jgi:hypothetical protein